MVRNPALPRSLQSSGGFPTASLKNISRELRREHICFNKMLRLSRVNEQRLLALITLVIAPQNCTDIATSFAGYRAGLCPFRLGA
jgi:hypothetical protein